MTTTATANEFTFGIYAAAKVGQIEGLPNDPEQIERLVTELQGTSPFIVREYLHFYGSDGAADPLPALTMPDTWYVERGRQLDLVLSYLPPSKDIPGWLAFIERVIARYGSIIHFLQITLEPNFPIPNIDGSSPGILDALQQGIPAARRLLDARGLTQVEIGFSVAEPAEWLGGDDAFWQTLATFPPESFTHLLDYVGLGLYPDAFSPVASDGQPGDLRSLTAHALHHLRTVSRAHAGIPATVPIRVAESGSPSSGDRSPTHQARSLATMIETVVAMCTEMNVRSFVLLGLRDAETARDDPLARFGLTDDRYRPKPAYAWYRERISRSREGV